MDFDFSPKVIELRQRLVKFMDRHVYPNDARHATELAANAKAGRPYAELPMMAGLKAKAREQGLWNLFLPDAGHGPGLTNVE
jgi:acyl-CoA dehydrogenase